MPTVPADLLNACDIKDDRWDVIIAGDGSGSRYGWPGGWAAIVFDKETSLRKLIYGSLSDTTVNVMELSPYVYSLMWYTRGPGADLQKKIRASTGGGVSPRLAGIHILTDCDVIAKQGNHEMAREANLPLWRAIDAFERLGYNINWHWIPRDTLAANRICDYISKEMRMTIAQITPPDIYDDHYGEQRDLKPL